MIPQSYTIIGMMFLFPNYPMEDCMDKGGVHTGFFFVSYAPIICIPSPQVPGH